ncbi:hypothetical protein KWG76_17695 [Haloterrigena longa]|uniref:Cell division protein A N-terminal domain-containing protein n=2 Tax=Natrinema longum TaxID=370324 RepID=A0A8A2U9R3_9EURY|nr:hypothetical protein [Natrinema longum]MBZ6496734.1 hypothetical protein [Natrinema longum]QSW85374.1 hypothetical protein J0X27_00540 [Natrinema longum]
MGTVLALVGIASFFWASSFPRGDPAYWQYRQAGIALAASALPLAMLGMTFRLPLQPAATVIGGVGVLLCGAAIGWFLQLYPSQWTFAGPSSVLLTYTGGVTFLAAGLTVVPFVTTPTVATPNQSPSRQPYYELHEGDGGWTWILYDSVGHPLAESTVPFDERAAARDAVTELSVTLPVAGTEVTVSGVQNE